MRKNNIWFVLLLLIITAIEIFLLNKSCKALEPTEQEVKFFEVIEIPVKQQQVITPEEVEISEEDKKMQEQIDKYKSITNKQECTTEWFLEYKSFIETEDLILCPPEVLSDCYTEPEIELMCRVVETECHGGEFESKVNVANVIFNRQLSDRFPNDISEIIKAPNQFSYAKQKIEDNTLLAIEYAFLFEDTTSGALFFKASPGEKWNGEELKMVDRYNGHHFY